MAQRIHHSVALALLIGAALVLVVFDPESAGIYPACPFHALTGWFCPLCGTTRALHALLAGHPLVALRCNAVTVAAVLWAAAWYAIGTGTEVHRGATFSNATSRGTANALARFRPRSWLALAFVFGVVRNLPGGAGSWLAP